MRRNGNYDSLLVYDVNKNQVTGQLIGQDDNVIQDFQVSAVRAERRATSLPSTAWTQRSHGHPGDHSRREVGERFNANGSCTSRHRPGFGTTITADFGYFWRCRFLDDTVEFSNFMNQLFEVQQVNLQSVRA